jgi:hypothetical protein
MTLKCEQKERHKETADSDVSPNIYSNKRTQKQHTDIFMYLYVYLLCGLYNHTVIQTKERGVRGALVNKKLEGTRKEVVVAYFPWTG